MVIYSFYTDYKKQNLVWRTQNSYSTKKEDAYFFADESSARKDFFELLFDDGDLRIGEYLSTETKQKKEKVKKEKPAKVVAEKVVRERIVYDTLEPGSIYNEDCLVTMGRMPDNYVDCIITSPPYNTGGTNVEYGDAMYKEYDDNLSPEAYENWLFNVIDECIRVTRKHVFFNIQMLSNNKRTICRLQGRYAMHIKDIIIWTKSIAVPNIQSGIMNAGFEYIFIFSKQKPESKKFEDALFSQGTFRNVIHGTNAGQNEYSKLNHATYPLYIPRRILNAFGEKDDLVYDPFTGTGTTQVACVIENRQYMGSELDPEQCEVVRKRLMHEKMKNPIKF